MIKQGTYILHADEVCAAGKSKLTKDQNYGF